MAISFSTTLTSRAVVFGNPCFRTEGDLAALAFLADGLIASVEEPGILRRWDAGSGRTRQSSFLSDRENVWCFGNGGRLLATGSRELVLWDVAHEEIRWSADVPSWIMAIAFVPDGSILATGHEDGSIRIWGVAHGELLREFNYNQQSISALALNFNGKLVASAGEDRVIALWESSSGRLIRTFLGQTDRICALVWQPDWHNLVSASWDSTAWVWNPDDGKPILVVNYHSAPLTGMTFDHTGELLALGDMSGKVSVYQLGKRRFLFANRVDSGAIQNLAFSADGTILALAGEERIIRLLNSLTGQQLAGGTGGEDSECLLALKSDGQRLAVIGQASWPLCWDCVGGKVVSEFHLEEGTEQPLPVFTSITWSPDGRWVAAGSKDGLVRIWDDSASLAPKVLNDQDNPITALSFSSDSRFLAGASRLAGEVWIWDADTGEPALLVPDALQGCAVEALAFHPNNHWLIVGGIDWLATGGSSGAICMWDLIERCEIAMLPGGTTALAVHPDGNFLAAASLENTVCLWNLNSQELIAELDGPGDAINCLAWNQEGTTFACAGDDRKIRLWQFHAPEGKSIALQSLASDSQTRSLAFSLDGKFIYSGNANSTCYRLALDSNCQPASGDL